MKWLDRYIRDLRIKQALPFIKDGDRLLDVGCHDATMLRRVRGRVKLAVGIDPLAHPMQDGNLRIVRGVIGPETPAELSPGSFDCITMLAVLEHVPETAAFARDTARLLAPGGRVVITVPDVKADHILGVLRKLGLIHGMSLEEHHGYDVRRTQPVFEAAGLTMVARRAFELGLNNLYVFESPRAENPLPVVLSRTQPAASPVAASA